MNYFLIERVTIQTYDNPGWGIYVYFKDKISKDRERIKLRYNSDKDWFYIFKDKNYLQFGGDEKKLENIFLEIMDFLQIQFISNKSEILKQLRFLQTWYANECDEYWEHLYGVQGLILDNRFEVTIDLDETYWENERFSTVKVTNRYICEKKEKKFIASGTLSYLPECLEHFKNWIESQ